ncbi:MAG: 50S ribosomal protein L11 methyltransferase [Desulfobacterales bacterium]|nr:50S ribosomal protein L11 methyltransferase [Desulfobacterales bacterium]
MQWIEAKVTFASDDENLAVELISDLFQNLGTSGVVVDDPHMEPVEGWGSDAVPRPLQPAVTGYLPADARLENRRAQLEQSLADLARNQGLRYTITYQALDEQDWAEAWKAFFHPQPITARLVVKPTWREYTPTPGQQVIEIDPGMAFGTGTHPTTAMCVQLLENHLQPDDSVLDVGTGSGILLIAAAKLGAGRLSGVDLDPIAVAIARENLDLNGLPKERADLHCGHLVDTVTERFDLVVANILADVIIDLLDQVPAVLAPGGRFICSGIVQDRREEVLRKMESRGLRVIETLDQDEWVALAGRI